MDVFTLVFALAAVVMVVLGGYLVVSVPRAIRNSDDSVFVKTLGVMLMGGGGISLLGLGGAILAALAGVASVAIWLAITFMAGAGVVALAVVGFTAGAVWRTVTSKRRTSVR